MDGILSRLGNASGFERAIVLACLAGISAVASDLYYDPAELRLLGVPLLPGLCFAAVIATGFLAWHSRSLVATAVLMIALTFAWMAAVKSAIAVHEHVMELLRESAKGGSPPTPDFLFALSGVVGGLVGSSMTAVSLAALAREFRVFANWGRIVTVGTVAGTFLECASGGSGASLPIHIDSLLPLFLVWQTSVAASIGYGIVPRLKYELAVPEPSGNA